MRGKALFCLFVLCLMVGVVSAVTVTVYPTVDGYTSNTTANTSYSGLRDTEGTAVDITNPYPSAPALYTAATTDTNLFNSKRTQIYSFNISSVGIPPDAIIYSVKFYGSFTSTHAKGLGTPTYGITGGTLATNTTIVAGDHNGFTDTVYSDTYRTYAECYGVNNLSWPFNMDGISAIDKDGFLVLYLRDSWDISGTFGGSWAANAQTRIQSIPMENDGTAIDPHLEISYYTGSPEWPKIMLMFDDGDATIFTEAYPLMSPYNINATAYVNSETIGLNPTKLYLSNLTVLYDDGWDIANHGSEHTDLTTVNSSEQERIISTGQGYLDTNGFTRSSHHVAYPYGKTSEEVIASAASVGALTGRNTTTGSVIIPQANLLDLPLNPGLAVGSSDSVNTVETLISAGVENQTMLVLFHAITDEVGEDNWPPSKFEELMDWINYVGYETITISEWYALNEAATTPPASITNLTGEADCNSVSWSFDVPEDVDYAGFAVWQNGTFLYNVTDPGITYEEWYDLAEDTEYTISIKTFDETGNMNETFVNETKTTNICATPTPTPTPTPVLIGCENQTGNISVALYGVNETALAYGWDINSTITALSFDFLFYDFNAWDPFITIGDLLPGTVHRFKVSNETDYGLLICRTNETVVVETQKPWTPDINPSTEVNYAPENLFGYWWVPALLLGLYLLFRRS